MIWLRISWAAAMLTALERRCRKYVTKDVAVHDWPTSSAGSLRLCISASWRKKVNDSGCTAPVTSDRRRTTEWPLAMHAS